LLLLKWRDPSASPLLPDSLRPKQAAAVRGSS
jgi:hypothetical protein